VYGGRARQVERRALLDTALACAEGLDRGVSGGNAVTHTAALSDPQAPLNLRGQAWL
jgi:hypothetical protein